jgi:hypothetical protein
LQQESSEVRELTASLEEVATWATELSDLLWRQQLQGKVNPDLLFHARDLVSLVQNEQAKMERKNSPH